MAFIHKISKRGLIAYVHDTVMAALSFWIAIYLRIGPTEYTLSPADLVRGCAVFTLIAAGVFLLSGLYRGVWRYASLRDLVAITRATSLTVLFFVLVMFSWTRLEELPRSLPVINWFVLMALLGGPRFLYRVIKDRGLELHRERLDGPRVPVLLAGSDDGAELFIRALRQSGDANYRVVGIAAERPERVGRQIHGVDVLGTTADLAATIAGIRRTGDRPQRVILTKDAFTGAKVRDLLDQCTALGLTLARMPKVTDFHPGTGEEIPVRPVDVEDLLGRPQTPLDREAMARLVAGRRVLITGAGGSIGGELARQAAALGPADLILLEQSEYALYEIDQELGEKAPETPRRTVIADVRDQAQVGRVFAAWRPELVFHAAALKHVPLVEANPVEGLATNVLGTYNVALAARDAGAQAMVLISTDKAVNPTSVMGASKRMAEICCQALDLESRKQPAGTRFVTVRFGNVLGSTGSVVPLFQRQLAAGGPLTVTHPEMTRYFMTIREAVELVLQASAQGVAADADGRVYVLDMGEPVKIIDLARQMIRLTGLEPDRDVAIEISGIRPGEKLYEEIFHGEEAPVPTDHAGVLLATPRAAGLAEAEGAVADLRAACAAGDAAAAAQVLHRLVPEYSGAMAGAASDQSSGGDHRKRTADHG